jgi:hypothetical protein
MRESTGYLESLWLLLFGIPLKSELCDDCVNDLENYKSENIDPNLTFDGPFLVRKEDGYSVASLPYCNVIIPQSLLEIFEWQQLLKILKNDLKKQNNGQYWNDNVFYTVTVILKPKKENASPLDINMIKECLIKATLDPDPLIRKSAVKELEKLG